MSIGRISGPMLKSNLERLGVDLAFETDLLYLSVTDGKVGINTDVPTRELTVNGTAKTDNLIIDNGLFDIGTLQLNGVSNTVTTVGNSTIEINSPSIILSELKTDNIFFKDNIIGDVVSNESLNIVPSGTGTTDFYADTNITGDLTVRDDITFNGTISFGDNSAEDTVSLTAKIDSDLNPADSDVYDIGSPSKQWLDLHTRLINGIFLNTSDFSVPGITSIVARPGNIIYVSSVNGDDDAQGDHQMSPYRTVKYALSQAQFGDQVYIYDGEYEEEFPLTVPEGVTVQGEGIRSVKIFPTTDTNDKDAFLLNNQTTVENLTVTDFYYNSSDNTGYGFRFAAGANINTRSPYVRNISVITSSDSAQESAGRGALVDGATLASGSKEASMLFHSVTFLVPDNIGLYMTNGVRVEWLNSFTYFASRGLYATNGSIGRLTADGSTIKRGAELRSIGSANVYGTVGAEADGDETLMYLIQHNFAYIGSGTDTKNDPTLVDQLNEVVEVNDGKIYYQSIDQEGDFRVGDAFIVDQQTGFVTLNGLGAGPSGINQIAFASNGNLTFIDANGVQTGSIRVSGNTVETISGDLNVAPSSGETDISGDVEITDNLSVDGTVTINGVITLGDSSQEGVGDTISFDAGINIDLEPTIDLNYNLGSEEYSWKSSYINKLTLDNISIEQNTIKTTESSSDLELEAAGSGVIRFVSDVELDQNITISGSSTLSNLVIAGNLNQVGDTNQTGNRTVIGDVSISGVFDLSSSLLTTGNVIFDGNRITTTDSNSNLELQANGNGIILIPQTSVTIENNLTVPTITVPTIQAENFTSETFDVAQFVIEQNNIIADTNINLILESLTNTIEFASDVETSADVDVLNDTLLNLLSINGNVTHTGNLFLTGNSFLTGNKQISENIVAADADFSGIKIDNNIITTVDSNADLELRAAGTGEISILNFVQIETGLSINSNFNFNSLESETVVGAVELTTGDIRITENYITTSTSDNNLELKATGTGLVVLNDSLEINNDLSVNNITVPAIDLNDLTVTGNINVVGNSQRSGISQIQGLVSLNNDAEFTNVSIDGNIIRTVDSNSDLELRAAGAGSIRITEDVLIKKNLTVAGQVNIDGDITVSKLVFNSIANDQILVNDNYITTTISNSDLDLRANGTGILSFETNDVIADRDFSVEGFSDLDSITVENLTHTGSIDQTGNRNHIGTITIDGNLDSGDITQDNIQFINNRIATLDSNSDLELRAAGTGKVIFDKPSIFERNLLVSGNTTSDNISVATQFQADIFQTDDVRIFNDTITTTLSNSNLNLRAVTTVQIDDLTVENNVISSSSDITLAPVGNLDVKNSSALRVPRGSAAQNPQLQSQMRFDTEDSKFWGAVPFSGVYSLDRRTRVVADDNNTLVFTANQIQTAVVNNGGVELNGLNSGNLILNNNRISSVIDTDINLAPQGTGDVVIDEIIPRDNVFENQNATAPLTLSTTRNGYVKFNSTTGLVIPAGTNAQRSLTPEVGELRYNVESNQPEVYNGNEWATLAGDSVTASEQEIDELATIYGILLG